MKLFKLLRKPYLAMLLAGLVLFVSCEQYQLKSDTDEAKFDYSLYYTYQGKMLSVNLKKALKVQNNISRLELNEAILDEINLQLGTDLDYSVDFKSMEIKSSTEVMDWGLQNNLLDDKDVTILNDFISSTVSNGIENALSGLEADVFKNMELSVSKVQKYEELANTVRLINEENPEIFDSNLDGRSCLWAVIGIIFAFVALVLACPSTVPTGGLTAPACYWAAANFIRASIVLGKEC